MNKNQHVIALIMGGAAGTVAEFAKAAGCSYSHARGVVEWLVHLGFAQVADGIYQRAVYRLGAEGATSPRPQPKYVPNQQTA